MPPIPSPEFRRAAVARVRDSGLSIRDVATEVGVSYESLRSWRKQEQADLDEQLTSSERAGVRRLLHEAQVSPRTAGEGSFAEVIRNLEAFKKGLFRLAAHEIAEADTERVAREIRAIRLQLNCLFEEQRATRRALDASQSLSRDPSSGGAHRLPRPAARD